METQCYKFSLHLYSSKTIATEQDIFDELGLLMKLIYQQNMSFSPLDCFSFSRVHLFGTLIALTSFTPVLIQFNRVD